MALIVRIDVDRPYGKEGFIRHVASYLSSEYYFPRIAWLGYLDELKVILRILNEKRKPAYVCFRRCSLPSPEVIELMRNGGHVFALHLENSRSFETFQRELLSLKDFLKTSVNTFSKHGSGRDQYGWNHFAPYEPEKYLTWAKQAGMKLFMGNLEDPTLEPVTDGPLVYFPAAFWLEPDWRDTQKYPIEWLLSEARKRDVVMLLHPDNVVSDQRIMNDFVVALDNLPSELLTTTVA